MRRFAHIWFAAAALAGAGVAHAQTFRVLVFSKTAGFRHTSIPNGIAAIQTLALQNCYEVEATEDAGAFTAANLDRFRVVVFLNTTGDVLDSAQQAAFEAWLQNDHGWVGIHSAADTEYGWPFYGEMLGAYFASHPAPQTASVVVEPPLHRSTSHLPNPWERFDEWYNFQTNPRPNVRVLLRLDEATYAGGTMGADHPIAWLHEFQGGRAWYTAGGHTEESYSEPLFTHHLLGGILWAADRHGCGCYANCDASTEPPILNVNDFVCFQQTFAAGDPLADCNLDGSLNVNDFVCFQQAFAAGCE